MLRRTSRLEKLLKKLPNGGFEETGIPIWEILIVTLRSAHCQLNLRLLTNWKHFTEKIDFLQSCLFFVKNKRNTKQGYITLGIRLIDMRSVQTFPGRAQLFCVCIHSTNSRENLGEFVWLPFSTGNKCLRTSTRWLACSAAQLWLEDSKLAHITPNFPQRGIQARGKPSTIISIGLMVVLKSVTHLFYFAARTWISSNFSLFSLLSLLLPFSVSFSFSWPVESRDAWGSSFEEQPVADNSILIVPFNHSLCRFFYDTRCQHSPCVFVIDFGFSSRRQIFSFVPASESYFFTGFLQIISSVQL